MERLLFLYNPMAGDGRIAGSLSAILDILTKAGFEVTVHPTQKALDAALQVARRAHQYDRIVAAGGDGLLHEVINGMAALSDSVPLGYIPAGTTNDFANTHSLSLQLEDAAKIAGSHTFRNVDMGLFNSELFAYVACCGIATHVSYDTSQHDKKRFGPLAYLANALASVDYTHWENNSVAMEISWKGGSAKGDFIFCAISNSRYVAGSEAFASEDFLWDDGLLEGFFIRRPRSIAELNQILSGILFRDFSSGFFVQAQSSEFEIVCDPTDWSLDGEFGGHFDRVHIETWPKKLLLAHYDGAFETGTQNIPADKEDSH